LFRFFLNLIPRKILIALSPIASKVLALLLTGNRVECYVCGRRFRKFLPYGYETSRDNVLCPNCLSLERHRLIWYYINHFTDLCSARHTLLHVAPEQCFYKRFRQMDNIEYVTADLESPLAEVKLDIQDMPFEDNTFDAVFCNHVFEHIPDDGKAMREVLRVMKPGAWAVLQVPMKAGAATTFEDDSITDRAERARHFGQYDHLRLYGRDYGDVLRKQGFDVEELDIPAAIGPELTEKYRLSKNEILYIGRKPVRPVSA
jgi:SAM-dependent methyltransferase